MRVRLSYLFHPPLYISAGVLAAVLAGIFNHVFYWVAVIPAGVFLVVSYGRKKWLVCQQLQYEALVLEEDFIP
ncbi:hypothetical protein [Paraflavitalea speifideaquila]|uniref:hypothetical protein n=1 Tax=Paraflavitalea speifideaquila TaxID=3076558 RepID=UPI0028E25585|nr:hypothetical protein [Paraflavitalea speifideiaquila]